MSVLGLGSEAGAHYRRMDGSIAGRAARRRVAARARRAGGGRYAALAADDADLRALGVLDPARMRMRRRSQGEQGRVWQDEGYWLLPPLMLLALFAFRRRAGLAVLLLCVVPAVAIGAGGATCGGGPTRPRTRACSDGAQAYRKGDFARAAQRYDGIDSADAHYNRGNALAKAGQYPQAIGAYDEALRRQPAWTTRWPTSARSRRR